MGMALIIMNVIFVITIIIMIDIAMNVIFIHNALPIESGESEVV